jgi:hypothetical protein
MVDSVSFVRSAVLIEPYKCIRSVIKIKNKNNSEPIFFQGKENNRMKNKGRRKGIECDDSYDR